MSDEPVDEHWCDYYVTPRYLAGSSYVGDPGFAPVNHWPHHSFDNGPCQLMVTSPDHRIRIGWYGDDYILWKITAAVDGVSAPRWEATFDHTFPPEIVAGLTTALAHDWGPNGDRFLARPSVYWADSVEPLLDTGWERGAAERGTVELLAPDHQAGALIDTRSYGRDDETVTLWAGPPGWASRAEAHFTADTPSHLIAATAAAMSDPAPVVRERHMLHQDVEHLVQLELTKDETPSVSRVPTPLDARRAAVTAAVHRAAHSHHGAGWAHAARIRTAHARPQPNATPVAPARAGTEALTRTAARPRR
ncbi:DUF317 domain-containing protein [Streptomyces yatensis]|uniref:DUF317 domain-containing protein n=1 Tax=Streptomyces yatensis TaxID=155177 RepID=A0ABP4UMG1_9ACTN|nr:DUF317 domain-containing protein [Streptomyces yatensis]